MNILGDIFGVHKALLFGRLQRKDFSREEFMDCLKRAEQDAFKEVICSAQVTKHGESFALSLYPEYLINDDIFEIMACHFAVSSVVQSMGKKLKKGDELRVFSVVIPDAISSRYDADVRYEPTITSVDRLAEINSSGCCVHRVFESKLKNVVNMAVQIEDMIKMSKLGDDEVVSKNIVIVFNRYESNGKSANTIYVFGCDDQTHVNRLYGDYFLCFNFHVSTQKEIAVDANDGVLVTRCWMNFGVGQRLRFYPEYGVWIVPHLFVRSTKMTAHTFLERLYSEEYKHGWRVGLDDPVFNKYYHIITQHEHVSNNYNRQNVEAKHKDVQRLLRDFLDQKLKLETAVKFSQHIAVQAYDSEAILEDMEDEDDSNIACSSGFNDEEFRNVKWKVLQFRNMECRENAARELGDCEHIDILVRNLRKFEECGLVVDALNVVQFDVDSIITAFDHVIKVHGFLTEPAAKLKVQDFIAKQVICDNGAECCILNEHSQRTRERENVEEKRAEPVHEVDTLCEVTSDSLNSVHCYLLHRDVHLYRLLSGRDEEFVSRFSTAVDEEEQKGDDEEAKDDGVKQPVRSHGINFGLNVLQWLSFGEQPDFGTVGEELVRNPDSTIDDHILQQYLMICLAKITGTTYTVNEMLCLKMYTDTNEMQSQLRRAHWTAALLKVRKAYYQWAMGLHRAHLYHAVPIPTSSASTSKPCRLYHGLNRLFTVSRELPVYFGPFSTTIARTVASTFCNEQGLIWLIQSSYANPLKLVLGINVDWISGFKHEREVLLHNQCLPIQETETFDDDSDILMNHFIQSLISRESPIIKKDAFYKQLGVGLDAEWMHSICEHELLFEKTECKGMRVVDRLVTELNLVEPDLVLKLWEKKHDEKSELEYMVTDLGAIQLSDHYQVLTSKFKIDHFSPLLNRTWLQFTGNHDDKRIKETEYAINGESANTTACSVKGQVTRIEVKNAALLGKRFVNLQKFEDEQSYEAVSDEFIDSLTVDRYGFVFVDNIPKKKHQFAFGDVVECKRDSQWIQGVVSRNNADQICVKIGDNNLFSFQWIERDDIPSKVALVFQQQKDINKYEFILSSTVNDDTQKLSDLKHHSFTDIDEFEIPCSAIRNHQSDVHFIGIYAKPKRTQLPLIKIRNIEYPSSGTDEFGNIVPFATTPDTESMVKRLIMTLKDRDSEIWDNVAFLNFVGLDIDRKSEWMQCITDHSSLFDVTLYRSKLVIERLIVELNLLSTDWIHRILRKKKQDKPLLEWFVEDRKVFRLLNHYRVITSKFKMEKYSKLLNCSWLKMETNNKINDIFDINGQTETTCFEESQYRINGISVHPSHSTIDGRAQVITVQNQELFGDDEVTLQRFDRMEQEKGVRARTYFGDILSINDDGVISIQIDVERTVKVQENGKWIQGVVSRVTADKICVKIGEDDLFAFQWIEKQDIWSKIKLVSMENENEISEFEFAARAGGKDDTENVSNLNLFTFGNVDDFKIASNLLVATSSSVNVVYIYAKPKGKELGYHRIKTIEHQFNPCFFSQYFWDQQDPFCINEKVKVRPYSESLKYGGKFKVMSSADIIISECGGINISEYIGDRIGSDNIKSTPSVDGVSGGMISLLSDRNVVNEGTLSCKGTESNPSSKGTVCIIAEGLVENKGIIDGGSCGDIEVHCARFVNEGQITPNRNLLITIYKSMNEWIGNLFRNGKEQLIKLEVDSHRGHFSSKHIKNVLKESSYYDSKGHGPPNEDWFVFRTQENKRFIPKRIAIRNFESYGQWTGCNLKKISIAGKRDDDGANFMQWIEIDDIKKGYNELQSFPVDESAAYIAWKRGFNLFRINVLENYGHSCNVFKEFCIYGMYNE